MTERGVHRSHVSGRRWGKKLGQRHMDEKLAERAENLERELRANERRLKMADGKILVGYTDDSIATQKYRIITQTVDGGFVVEKFHIGIREDGTKYVINDPDGMRIVPSLKDIHEEIIS